MPREMPKSGAKGFEIDNGPHQTAAQGRPGRPNKTIIRTKKKVNLMPTRAEESTKTIMKNILNSIEEVSNTKAILNLLIFCTVQLPRNVNRSPSLFSSLEEFPTCWQMYFLLSL